MMKPNTVYFDHAATSYPKPPDVLRAVLSCMEEAGGNPGRGSHRLAMRAAERIYACREEAAGFFGAADAERVSFALNTTHALNTAIKGLLREGDHVLISDMEHNAVYRPVFKLAAERQITFDLFPSFVGERDRAPDRILDGIGKKIQKNTRLLVCTHASNICSATLPIKEIGEFCRRHGIYFVVDGAQSAGHLPIGVEDMNIDALCVPGHKGLFGPQGCGMLILGNGIETGTLTEGGSGYHSLEREMPTVSPERYEAGTLPTPAIAGLCEGIREVRRIGTDRIFEKISGLTGRLSDALSQIPGVTVYAKEETGGILLFSSDRVPADPLGRELDRRGFCVRCGFHCAALAHAALRTPPSGAVRVSPGFENTVEEIDAFADAVREILQRE